MTISAILVFILTLHFRHYLRLLLLGPNNCRNYNGASKTQNRTLVGLVCYILLDSTHESTVQIRDSIV